MSDQSNLSERLKARYLEILGVEEADPDLAFLNRIVSAHLVGAPFENISKLYRFRLDADIYS